MQKIRKITRPNTFSTKIWEANLSKAFRPWINNQITTKNCRYQLKQWTNSTKISLKIQINA